MRYYKQIFLIFEESQEQFSYRYTSCSWYPPVLPASSRLQHGIRRCCTIAYEFVGSGKSRAVKSNIISSWIEPVAVRGRILLVGQNLRKFKKIDICIYR